MTHIIALIQLRLNLASAYKASGELGFKSNLLRTFRFPNTSAKRRTKGKKMTSVTEAQKKTDNVELNRGCRLHVFKCAGSMWRPGLGFRGDTNRQSGVTSVRDKSWTVEEPMQVRKGPMCWRRQGRFPRNVHR